MLTSILLRKADALPRVQRNPQLPLTRITVLAGPNGSGKSTFIDTLREYIFARTPWTDETAPVDVDGSCQAVYFVSSELDNPRLYAKRGPDGRQLHSQQMSGMDIAKGMICREMSHGQSNYFLMEGIFDDDRFDVVVFDEPENALDLDGLGWLYKQIQKTSKQVIVVTHNPLLLKLKDEAQGSLQVFGVNPDYAQRVLDTYTRVIEGKRFGKIEKRRKNEAIPKPRRKNAPRRKLPFGLTER
jgi:predicted ATPase